MAASVRANDDFNRASLADQVQGALREEIITGRLAPNQRIDPGHYATLWSISQTPLREAIKQLESLGFVQVSPRRGVFVAALDRTALREIFELRIAMECTAARLATKNIPIIEARNALTLYTDAQVRPDDERAKRLPAIDLLIHDLAVKYCGNRRLQRLMESINDLVRWSRQTIIRNLPHPYDTTVPEHIRICEAVCDGDGERAASAMQDHLQQSLERIDDYLTKLEQDATQGPGADRQAMTA